MCVPVCLSYKVLPPKSSLSGNRTEAYLISMTHVTIAEVNSTTLKYHTLTILISGFIHS